jgi:hypothetical protein
MVSPTGYVPESSDMSARYRDVQAGGSGYGWLVFAGIVLVIAGILNTIYGIAAIGDSKFFVHNTQYVLSGLTTWGWVALILGVMQVIAAFSLWQGGTYGRLFGIAAAGLSSIAALMSIPAYPFWSLAIFTLDLLIIYGLASYARPARA